MDKLFKELMWYARSIWLRRWYLLVVAWAICLGGWLWVDSLPDRYQAEARVYVDTQSVLGPLMGDMAVRTDTEQRIRMMTRTLLTRPNMEEVVRRADMDHLANTAEERDALVTRLSQDIRMSGGDRENIYTIRYQHTDPELARRVVQSLLTMFVEEGLGDTRQDVVTSQRFIEEQINHYQNRLAEKESRIEDFRQEHMDVVRRGSGSFYDELQQVRENLEQARLEYREAENRRQTLERRMSGDEPVLLADQGESQAHGATPALDRRIAELESQLDNMRRRFTDDHPDVTSTQRIIAELKEEREEAARNAPPAQHTQNLHQNRYYQQLQYALADVESRVSSLQARVQEYEQRYQQLQEAVEGVPQIESEYAGLRRDYDILKNNYERLLQIRERAAMSGQLESQAEAVEFRVIEPPRVPPEPAAPDRPVLASAVLVAGVGAGLGFAFLMGQLRRTVMTRDDLSAITGQPVIGMVSRFPSPAYRARRALMMVLYSAAAAVLVIGYAALLLHYLGIGIPGGLL